MNEPLFRRVIVPTPILPESNIAPENGWLKHYFPFGDGDQTGRCYSRYFHGVYTYWITYPDIIAQAKLPQNMHRDVILFNSRWHVVTACAPFGCWRYLEELFPFQGAFVEHEHWGMFFFPLSPDLHQKVVGYFTLSYIHEKVTMMKCRSSTGVEITFCIIKWITLKSQPLPSISGVGRHQSCY